MKTCQSCQIYIYICRLKFLKVEYFQECVKALSVFSYFLKWRTFKSTRPLPPKYTDGAAWRCSVKRVFLKFCKIDRKVPLLVSLFDKMTPSVMSFCVFIVNTEQISHIALAFLLLTLNKWIPSSNIYQALQSIARKLNLDYLLVLIQGKNGQKDQLILFS